MFSVDGWMDGCFDTPEMLKNIKNIMKKGKNGSLHKAVMEISSSASPPCHSLYSTDLVYIHDGPESTGPSWKASAI